MKHLYFLIFAHGKYNRNDPERWKYYTFGEQRYNEDLAGLVPAWAKSVGCDIKDVRLFVYPTRKEWEKAKEGWR